MTDVEPVPLVDLGWQHREVAAEVGAGIEAVMTSGAFIGGPDVAAFEAEFAAYTGARHCVGVGNGTDALELALRAAGVEPGREVVIPANTFVATAEAVVRAGCQVRLVDCEPWSQLIDAEQAIAAVTENTGAIIGVDLYGQVAAFERLADARVLLLEDAAQAQGARRFDKGAGTFGVAAGTSFYPGKNLGAYGDGGAVLTDDDDVADRVRALRNHGGTAKYEHRLVGTNSRLDTIQAVVLRAKLRRLDGWNTLRRQAAARYAELLADLEEVVLPAAVDGNEHVWHLYVVEVPDRDRVLRQLNAASVGAGIHYPAPVHMLEAFTFLGHREGEFPVAEGLASRILSLPLFPGITEAQQERVAEELHKALR